MTSEQEEAWKEALMPVALGVIGDGYELTAKGLEESRQRLMDWGAPGWAVQLRVLLLLWGSEQAQPWKPEFALRSGATLVGISLLIPTQADRVPLYERVFVRFVQESLRPFVEHARHVDAYRRNGYESLIELYVHCERFTTAAGVGSWLKQAEPFCDPPYDEDRPEVMESFWAISLEHELLGAIRSILYLPTTLYWEKSRISDLEHLIELLNRLHQWRLDGCEAESLDDGPYYTGLIAAAYLTALEAECPPPDWLIGSQALR